MKIESNEQLAEFIADRLPITEEDALLFVNGVLNGYMFNDKIIFSMALSSRDRLIEELDKEVQMLRKREPKKMNKKLIDYIRDHAQCNYSDIIDYFMDLNECTSEGQDKVKAGHLMDLLMYISEQEVVEESQ